MKTTTRHLGNLTVVAVSGVVDSSGAGRRYDILADAVQLGGRLIVDVAGITCLTRAGVRGLVVAARLAKSRRGDMRIRNASPETEDVLSGLGFGKLFPIERDPRAGVSSGCGVQFATDPVVARRRPFRGDLETDIGEKVFHREATATTP